LSFIQLEIPADRKRSFKSYSLDAVLAEVRDLRGSDDHASKGRAEFVWTFADDQYIGPRNQVSTSVRVSLDPNSKFYYLVSTILGNCPDELIRLYGFDGLVQRLIGRRSNLSIKTFRRPSGEYGALLLRKIRPPRESSVPSAASPRLQLNAAEVSA
jgi:hypothetical protein